MIRCFQTPELRPEQLNDENQITDKKILNRDRFKFGIASMMYQSEEVGLNPIHVMLVKMLGGGSLFVGLVGSASSVSSMLQWIGALLLRRFRSNKVAMNLALSGGIFFGLMLAGAMLLYQYNRDFAWLCLLLYLPGAYGLAGASGVQVNVESSWIGDLVPNNLRGYFTSVKWIISSLGVLFFLFLFGQVADRFRDHPWVFALIFGLVAVSHLVAILLMSTVTDRQPQSVRPAAADREAERMNYRSLPLWCYILFYVCWSGGRTSLVAFSTAYMLDYFGYGMGKITLLVMLQSAVSMVMLLLMGKVSDRFGARWPLILISGAVALAMSLWIASAWWGVAAIIAYTALNGAAGNTHTMLAINYSLEIFPARGRAAYIGFARIFMGASTLIFAAVAGALLDLFKGVETELWGARLVNYHYFFLLCILFTGSCVMPLLLAGRRRVVNRTAA